MSSPPILKYVDGANIRVDLLTRVFNKSVERLEALFSMTVFGLVPEECDRDKFISEETVEGVPQNVPVVNLGLIQYLMETGKLDKRDLSGEDFQGAIKQQLSSIKKIQSNGHGRH